MWYGCDTAFFRPMSQTQVGCFVFTFRFFIVIRLIKFICDKMVVNTAIDGYYIGIERFNPERTECSKEQGAQIK